jgi:6-phosphogluconolactonase
VFGYVGALTGRLADGVGNPAITVLEVEPGSGALSCVQTLDGLESPTYLALHPRLPVLYAGERHWPPMGAQSPGSGSITTLSIEPATGHLTVTGRRPSGGPAHLNVHPSGRSILAAMNRVLQVGAFPLAADGSVGPASAIVEHAGHGPKSPNQDRAFPHSSWFDQSATRVLCCDLGLDRIMLYDFDLERGSLQPGPQAYAQVSSGAGPRHLALHPNNCWLYVVNELDSTISAFAYDAESGRVSIQQTVSTLPDEFADTNTPAQIMVHPSGQFVYASNRGHDSIAIYAVDQSSGRLRLLAHQPSGGERPHNFTIDRSGRLMLVANQRSGIVCSFTIDASTGRLAPTGHSARVPGAVCVVLRDQA